ncbi:hypothetical protein PR048_015749, partial [Dryococelus australis]
MAEKLRTRTWGQRSWVMESSILGQWSQGKGLESRLCNKKTKPLRIHGDAVAERLACSPLTKANRVQYPAGSLPDFRMWKSCRTMPGISSFPRPFIPALLHTRLNHLWALTFSTVRTHICTHQKTSAPLDVADLIGTIEQGKWEARCSVMVRVLASHLGEPRSIPAWIYARGNRSGRCRWSAGFLGDHPFPPLLHSDAAQYSSHFTLIGSHDHDSSRSYILPLLLGSSSETLSGWFPAAGHRSISWSSRTRHAGWHRSQSHSSTFPYPPLGLRTTFPDESENNDTLLSNHISIPVERFRGEKNAVGGWREGNKHLSGLTENRTPSLRNAKSSYKLSNMVPRFVSSSSPPIELLRQWWGDPHVVRCRRDLPFGTKIRVAHRNREIQCLENFRPRPKLPPGVAPPPPASPPPPNSHAQRQLKVVLASSQLIEHDDVSLNCVISHGALVSECITPQMLHCRFRSDGKWIWAVLRGLESRRELKCTGEWKREILEKTRLSATSFGTIPNAKIWESKPVHLYGEESSLTTTAPRPLSVLVPQCRSDFKNAFTHEANGAFDARVIVTPRCSLVTRLGVSRFSVPYVLEPWRIDLDSQLTATFRGLAESAPLSGARVNYAALPSPLRDTRIIPVNQSANNDALLLITGQLRARAPSHG